MIIVCTNCATKFKVPDEKVTAAGIKVRCSKCQTIFKVTSQDKEKPAEKTAPTAAPKGLSSLEPKDPLSDISLDFDLDVNIGGDAPATTIPKPAPVTAPTPPAKKPPPPKPATRVPTNFDASDLGLDFDLSGGSKPAASKPSTPPPPLPPHPAIQPAPQQMSPPPLPPATPSPATLDQSLDQFLDGGFTDSPQPGPSFEPALDAPPPPPPDVASDFGDPLDSLSLTPGMAGASLSADSFPDVPITMPSEIELASFSQTAAPKLTQSGKVTEDGIELFDQGDPLFAQKPFEKSGRPGISEKSARPSSSPDMLPPPNFDAPPPKLMPKLDPPRSPPPQPKKSPPAVSLPPPVTFSADDEYVPPSRFGGMVKVILSLLVVVTLFVGFVLWHVHGRLSPGDFNAQTFSKFFQGSGGKKVQIAKGQSGISIRQYRTNKLVNVDNHTILVITGEVVNETEAPLSFLKVKAYIFSADDKSIAEKEVWAGNSFNRDEIYYFADQAAIDKAYVNTGKSLTNMNVAPHAAVPFQVLLIDPPEEWHHFRVVPGESQAASGT